MQLLTGYWVSKLEMVHKVVLKYGQTPFTCAHVQHFASNAHHSRLSIKYTTRLCGLDEVCLRVEGEGCEGRSGTYKLLLVHLISRAM